MTPSDRITLIKEVARRLSTEDWSIIDLTLKQFSLPWSPTWEGTSSTYVIQMLEEADADTLLALARHVGIDHEPGRSDVRSSAWSAPDNFRLFICHLASHKREAGILQSALLKYHFSCFVAHNDIQPSREWQSEIETALATADAMIVLMREGFHDSDWTDQEIGYTMGRHLVTLAVTYGAPPYGFIARFQALDGSKKKVEYLALEIFEVFRKNKQTAMQVGRSLLVGFEQSSTYKAAKENIELLEQVTSWDKSFADRIRTALKVNNQISEAYGVPERVGALVKKWKHTAP